MTQADPMLEPRPQSEAAEAPHPFADIAPAAADLEELAPPSPEEYLALQQALQQALAKADEYQKLYLSAHADMENLRKRTEREVQNAHKFALERFLAELLPVRDSLELGLAAAGAEVDVAPLRQGVVLTLKQLATAMEKFGVREVNPIGIKFNPTEHEAVAMAPTDQAEPNAVVQVMQKGYVLNDRLIRPAKVLVAQAPVKPSS
ncbi:MAG: nucleotide exchange factor GrpE [Candidatus Contendobacter sp.]